MSGSGCIAAPADVPGRPPEAGPTGGGESDSAASWLDRLGVEQPGLRRLGAYWDRLRGDRPLPRRAELEPWRVPDLLPSLWIWRVQRQPAAFHLRLAGERINRLVGYWRRGSELGEAVPGHAEALIRARFERVAFTPGVLRTSGYALLGQQHRVRVRAERLILPLGRSLDQVDDLLGITWYEELAPQPTRDHIVQRPDEQFLALETLDRCGAAGGPIDPQGDRR